MGTRDIYTAIFLTASFTVLSSFLLNESSPACIIPEKYKQLAVAVDTNRDGDVSEEEVQSALNILNKSRRAKQRNQFLQFHEYIATRN